MNKVTIITSLYKANKYLSGFLENIVEQTIFDQCELYLLNGNSPEKEEDIIQPYLDRYDNIKYRRLEKDPGIYECWNIMIKDSDSQFITNANVDDKLMPECIQKHVELLESKPNIDVAYCLNISSDNIDIQPWMIVGNEPVFTTANFSKGLMIQANLPHNHPVWRRSLHDKFGYFSTEFTSGSDWEFWLRCTKGNCEMELIPEKLGIYYRNPEGMSTKPENMDRNLQEVRDIQRSYMGLRSNER